MKAAICTAYGAPTVVQIQDVAKPQPKPGEVLVRIHRSTVSAADYRVRSFDIPLSFKLPARLALGILRPRKPILGVELSGVIEAVGEQVTQFKVGDSVFAATDFTFGAHAEYICLAENSAILLKPHNADFDQAACLSFGGLTALYFLRKAGLKPGQSVLIYGASGAVGVASVQIAKAWGAQVTAVCSSGNVTMVKSLGADRVIAYNEQDFTQTVGPQDVIFDTVGKTRLGPTMKLVKKGGSFLQSVGGPAALVHMMLVALFSGKRAIAGTALANKRDLQTLKDLCEAGKYKAMIDKTYSLDQIVEAHRYVDSGRKRGSVLIRIV